MLEDINKWLNMDLSYDPDLKEELNKIKDDKELMTDAFYQDLSFGTGGLRGKIGVGTNRMNVYTIIKATLGLASFLKKTYKDNISVAISFDSRIKSNLFAKIAASTLANENIKVYLYKELMPTPCLSFAVRYLKTKAGIMVTASHNPSIYNGYKVYDNNGCQITDKFAKSIYEEIKKSDPFNYHLASFETYFEKGLISYIEDEVIDNYIECVKKTCLNKEEFNKDINIIYTPLNGTGLKPVLRALKELNYNNVIVVEEQRNPDGNFPTCPYPNPEIKEAMALGLEYAKKFHADLLIATDPDCDRAGIGIKINENEYRLLSGNEVGILLLDYILSMRKKYHQLKDGSLIVKSIVTTPLANEIAKDYGVKTIDVLTGFKYIGEQINLLEEKHQEDLYVFGFEESYGYLSSSYVRDKDAVNATSLIVEMFCYYKDQNISLNDKLNQLYQKYNYCLNTLHSFNFEGQSGLQKMQNIMLDLRSKEKEFCGLKINEVIDYKNGVNNLKADVLKFDLANNIQIIMRQSGTEPKLKMYFFIKEINELKAREKEEELLKNINLYLAKF